MAGDPFKDLGVGKDLSESDIKALREGRDPLGEGRNVTKEKKQKAPEVETLPLPRKKPQQEGTLALAKGGKPVGVGVAQRGFGAVRRARKGGKMC